ncbi:MULTISPECIES: ester cyclase [Natrialbaceae]|uniref:ester cyclase n=1 Tax=Natrialbaceae TaxID=1644061 RepID=UPI00207CC05C|nr:ester cyclase [Natronococcus sp. CG52]
MEDQEQTEAENKAVVRDFIDAVFVEKDVEVADDFLRADYHEYATGNGESFRSREEFKAGNADFFAAFPDLSVTENGCIAEGDIVVYQHTLIGTHHGELLDAEPTGNEITLENVGVFRIEGGKIAELYLYADTISLLRRLGIVPEDPVAE